MFTPHDNRCSHELLSVTFPLHMMLRPTYINLLQQHHFLILNKESTLYLEITNWKLELQVWYYK